VKKFNPVGECSAGGIYFIEIDSVHRWLSYSEMPMEYFRIVTIPDDAKVYIENDKFKADKLILSERRFIFEDHEMCKKILSKDGKYIGRVLVVNNKELILIAINQSNAALRYIANQTEEICLIAINQWPQSLRFVEKQTPKICLAAVKPDGLTLDYVKEQTPEICLAAIEQNAMALQYVKEQTPELCMIAVKKNGLALKCAKQQPYKLIHAAIKQNPEAWESF